MTELLFIVPARGGSKRLPDKNIKPLCGMSLLEWTQRAAAASGAASPCLLTTDDPGIAEAGRALGWTVPFLRPAEIAEDDSPTELAVLHALDWYVEQYGKDPSLIMVLQPTSPLRRGNHIAAALAALHAHPEADAVVGVKRIHVGAANVYGVQERGYMVRLVGNAPGREAYVPNGAIYLIRTAVLRRTGSLVPPAALPLEMDQVASIDIDDPVDWRLAEAVLAFENAQARRTARQETSLTE